MNKVQTAKKLLRIAKKLIKADKKLNIANPEDYDYGDTLFQVSFGAVGTTHIYVWTDGAETAWEHAVEFLDDNKLVGYFVTVDEGDLEEAAEDLGIEWTGLENDFPSSDDDHKILESAEADLTSVSHTTLTNFDGPAYVPSYEWFLREVNDPAEKDAVRRESMRMEGDDEEDDDYED